MQGRFSDKEYAEGVCSAVGGNGTACTGNKYLLEGGFFGNQSANLFNYLGITACVGYEYTVEINVGKVGQTVFNIFEKGLQVFSAIFFANAHRTVFNLNAGLEF